MWVYLHRIGLALSALPTTTLTRGRYDRMPYNKNRILGGDKST